MALANGSSSPISLTLSTGGNAFCRFRSVGRADGMMVNNTTGVSIQLIWDGDQGIANASNSSPTIDALIVANGQSCPIAGITNTSQVWCSVSGATNGGQVVSGDYYRGLD